MTYTSEQMERVCRITNRNIQYWAETGLFSIAGEGTGKRRAFTSNDLLIAAVTRDLRASRKLLPKILGRKARYLVTDGRRATWCDTEVAVFAVAAKFKSGIYLLDMGGVQREISGRLANQAAKAAIA